MKPKPAKQPLTLLVLRDAQHSVKQVHLSKPLLIAVPAAAILSITGLILSMQIQSSRDISELERQLTLQHLKSLRMEITVSDKEAAIERLNQAIIQLSEEAAQTDAHMKSVRQLEEQLRTFIQEQGFDPSESSEDISSSQTGDPSSMGGEYIAVYEQDMLHLAEETLDDFERIRNLMETMEKAIPRTLDHAAQAQHQRESTPSRWPTESRRLTSSFGYRSDPINGRSAFHAGIDIAGSRGDPVYAAASGTVSAVEFSSARGRYVIIDHPDGLQTWYLHLDRASVEAGDQIKQGDIIGALGNTGRSTGAHLHFEVVKNNRPVNPLHFVD
ncbi:M23 family metallopeptidase [Paenibacillus lemnae]|uniref:M23 family metallopeptidase n=1 Tax=Paenibacillus lemnae TaxID=1330551 RepID=A0A848M547_PAELE|nr:M23 family metallopeptidase [Paenibacillus lemnae]NMO95726.1 M23 family metallopeptidase [Paenibacillus lemnae]